MLMNENRLSWIISYKGIIRFLIQILVVRENFLPLFLSPQFLITELRYVLALSI